VVSGLLIASIPAGGAFARSDSAGGDSLDGLGAIVAELREGARALRAVPDAGWIVSADVAGSFVYGAQTVLLLLVAERLGLGAGGYGYLLAGLGLGGIAGATLAGRLGPAAGRRSTLVAALVLVAAPLPVLALTTSAFTAIAAGVAGGVGALVVEVVADTRLQGTLEESRLGCAYGFAFAASLGGIALGSLAAPALVSLAGLGGALYAVAGLVLVLAAATALRSTAARRVTTVSPAAAET
jgi:MFS family permease